MKKWIAERHWERVANSVRRFPWIAIVVVALGVGMIFGTASPASADEEEDWPEMPWSEGDPNGEAYSEGCSPFCIVAYGNVRYIGQNGTPSRQICTYASCEWVVDGFYFKANCYYDCVPASGSGGGGGGGW